MGDGLGLIVLAYVLPKDKKLVVPEGLCQADKPRTRS